jgi:hypothetical protein
MLNREGKQLYRVNCPFHEFGVESTTSRIQQMDSLDSTCMPAVVCFACSAASDSCDGSGDGTKVSLTKSLIYRDVQIGWSFRRD